MELSDKEVEIAKYIIQGKKNYEIAKEINLSVHTVKFYIHSIIKKLGARNRTHAAYILGQKNIIIKN
ncbi:helix-turn-helix transcriptional regulator [bacterium]|nr:helix-turn-helix transcriptional regulator [bacterium]